MKRIALIIAMLAATMGANAQWLDFTNNNRYVTIGFNVGNSGVGTEFSKLGLGGSLSICGVYVDFLSVSPEHKYDNHVTNTLYEDSATYTINVGYQIPVLPWLRVAPILGYCQTNYGRTDATTVNVENNETSSRIYHDYDVYAGARKHYFNYGVGLFVEPVKYFDLYGVVSRRAIYGGISINLGAFSDEQ